MTATFAFCARFFRAAMFFAIASAKGNNLSPLSNSKSEIISIISSTTSDLSGALPCKSSFFGIFLFFLLLFQFFRFLFAHLFFIRSKEKINGRRADNQNQNHHRGNKINFGGGGIRHTEILSQGSCLGQKATRKDLFVSNTREA